MIKIDNIKIDLNSFKINTVNIWVLTVNGVKLREWSTVSSLFCNREKSSFTTEEGLDTGFVGSGLSLS